MSVHGCGLSIHYVNSAAVCPPSRHAGCIVFIGISNTPVVLFLEFIFRGIRGWITSLPEAFNKNVALGVGGKLFKSGELFIRDDPANILVQPLLIDAAQFLDLRRFIVFLPGTFQRVLLSIRLRSRSRRLLVFFLGTARLALD